MWVGGWLVVCSDKRDIYAKYIIGVAGFILKYIGKHQMKYRPGHTIMKLALNIGNVLAPHNVPKDKFYDDDLYFAGEADEEDPQPPALKNGVLSKGNKD